MGVASAAARLLLVRLVHITTYDFYMNMIVIST
jgi:hypothetical protein